MQKRKRERPAAHSVKTSGSQTSNTTAQSQLSNPPKIFKPPKNVTVPEQGPAKFTAKIVGFPLPKVSWFIEGTLLEETGNIHMDFEPKSNIYNLTISDNLKGMSGKVKVLAVNKEGEATAEVNLIVTGRAASFLEKPLKCTALQGSMAIFCCKVDGDPVPEVKWFRGKDIEIEDSANYKAYFDERTNEHVLEIDNIGKKHAGIYTVNLENNFGREKTSAILVVTENSEEYDKWRKTLRRLKDSEMNNNILSANNNKTDYSKQIDSQEAVAESPQKKPEVQRRRRRKARSEVEHINTNHSTSRQTEKKSIDCSKNDSNLSNHSSTQSEVVTQRRRPRNLETSKIKQEVPTTNNITKPAFIRELQDLRIKEAESAEFECEANQSDLPITWFIDDIQVVPSQKYQIFSTKTTHKLVINNLKLDDEGEVKCRASNQTTSAHLFVSTMKPYFIAKFFNKKILEHADAYFICKLNEDLTVAWYHKGRIVPDDDKKYKILNEGMTKTLIIKDCSIEDSGVIKVFCRNVSCEANLRVQAFTSEFSKPLTNLTVRENSMAEFVCYTHHCQLRSSISWYIESNKVTESEKYCLISDGWKHSLRINKVSKMEEGKITVRCKGDECSADLIVDGQFFQSERVCKSVTHSPMEVIHDRTKCRLSSPVSPWKHGFECFVVQNDQNEIHCSRCEDSKKLLARMCECPREADSEKESDHKNSSIGRRINRKLRYLSCPDELSSSPRIKEKESVINSPKSDKMESCIRNLFSSPESLDKSAASQSSSYRSASGQSIGGNDVLKTLKDFSSAKSHNGIFDNKYLLQVDDTSETESSKSSLQYLPDVGKSRSRLRRQPNESPPWKIRERLSLPIEPVYPPKPAEIKTVKDRVKYFEHCEEEKPMCSEDFPSFERESVKKIVEKFEKLSIEGKLILIGRQEHPDTNIYTDDKNGQREYRQKFNSLLHEILKELDNLAKKRKLHINFDSVILDNSYLLPKNELSKEDLKFSIRRKIHEVERAIIEFLKALSSKSSKENKFQEGIVIYETIATSKSFSSNKYQKLDRSTLKNPEFFESKLQINPVTLVIKDGKENSDKQQFRKCLNEILSYNK
ncbi:DgyrCDS11848 [Dimorphilus gyrociliatus]|uniref:DgyrCDS11848 n=1 Tax=Dimorphilus gyrociliatus TaxID=2664684 RepID=A0A7I8W4P1_9ANNE|nr:DgyrCDS11848 [Dimorphilus gyrociliatus]